MEFQNTNKGFEEVTSNELAVQGNNGMMIMDDGTQLIRDLTAQAQCFCSMVAKTPEEQDILFMAQNSPEKRSKDCVNEVINLRHIFVEVVFCNSNEDESVKVPCPRVVLIDNDGVGYQSVSIGMYSAVKKLMQTYGNPATWIAPKQFKIKQISKGTDKTILTLEPVINSKKK